MILKDMTGGQTAAERRKLERETKEAALKQKCEAYALEKYGPDKLAEWRKKYGAIWYLIVTQLEADTEVDKLAVMQPINRHILGFATTKLNEDGMYAFLEAAMRECLLDGDKEIFEDEECFLAASGQFNKIIESRKANLLKA